MQENGGENYYRRNNKQKPDYPYKYKQIDPNDFPDYEDENILGNRYQSINDLYEDLYKHNSRYNRKQRTNNKKYYPHMKRSTRYSPRSARRKRSRRRRHVGPHDNEGLQRLLSTGTLAPTLLPLSHPNYNHSIDLVFGTYWFFPADTRAILPEDKKCIQQKLSEEKIRFSPLSMFISYVFCKV